MQQFWTATLASVTAGAVTPLGILTIRRRTDRAGRNTTYFASFASGVRIAVSFLHVVPVSMGMSSEASIYNVWDRLFFHERARSSTS